MKIPLATQVANNHFLVDQLRAIDAGYRTKFVALALQLNARHPLP